MDDNKGRKGESSILYPKSLYWLPVHFKFLCVFVGVYLMDALNLKKLSCFDW